MHVHVHKSEVYTVGIYYHKHYLRCLEESFNVNLLLFLFLLLLFQLKHLQCTYMYV